MPEEAKVTTERDAVSLHRRVSEQLVRGLSGPLDPANDIARLNESLRLIAKWRSVLIQDVWRQREGNLVKFGPFAGMQLLDRSGEGCHIAKMMGIYEKPLWPFIETVIRREYNLVLNVGAAEGYYAIGLARRMSSTKILAYESSTSTREILKKLVQLNGVQNRVHLYGVFQPADLVGFDGERILLICDIEGGEFDLLAGSAPQILRNSDLIVETHGGQGRRDTVEDLRQRFEATHDVTVITDGGTRSFEPPDWFLALSHLDQLLCTWEWRSAPTPWLFMTAKNWQIR